jgi:hypothetical protein
VYAARASSSSSRETICIVPLVGGCSQTASWKALWHAVSLPVHHPSFAFTYVAVIMSWQGSG